MSSLKILLFLLLFVSCAGQRGSTPDNLYSATFQAQIDRIKGLYAQGSTEQALETLSGIQDAGLRRIEIAAKYNLLGVFAFSSDQYDQALKHFRFAMDYTHADPYLKSQILLNLSSAYYKLGKNQVSLETFKQIDLEYIPDDKRESYHRVAMLLGTMSDDHEMVVRSSIELLGALKTITEVRAHPWAPRLTEHYMVMDDGSRLDVLEDNEERGYAVVAFLGLKELDKRYFSGDRSGARNILEWLESFFAKSKDVALAIEGVRFRMQSIAKVDARSIGVLLPLSGKNSKYGRKALEGIESALAYYYRRNPTKAPVLHVRDTQSNALLAKQHISHLVNEKNVSLLIGGLFPRTARGQYMQARKYGTVFVSLASINVARKDKNALLIEIPGSVQSQVYTLMQDESIDRLGKRVAVLHSNDESGGVVVDEFWRYRQQGMIELYNLGEFEKKENDFRGPVGHLLGLTYPRERKEEYDFLAEIYRLEGHRSIRRVQTLPPVLDFDWVFVSAFPHQAMKMLPAFRYYDVKGVNLVGGPSWMNRNVFNLARDMREIRILGIDPLRESDQESSWFLQRYKRPRKLLELLGQRSIQLANSILSIGDVSSREALEGHLRKRDTLSAGPIVFRQVDGLWIKEMDLLEVWRGKPRKARPPVYAPTSVSEREASSV